MEQLLICMSLSLIAGLLASRAAKAVRLPAVTSYLVAGLLLGPFFLGRLGLSGWGFGFGSLAQVESYGIITQVALGFIAFVIGNEFRLSVLESMGRQAITVGILQAVITTVLVDIALVALHFARPDVISMASAITLGAIASATEQLLICMSLSLIAGLLASRAAKAVRLPAVTSYLVAGLLLGPFFLGRLGLSGWGFGFGSLAQVESYGIITQVALGFIAFVIGNEFRLSVLESMGRQAITVGILQAVITTVLVDIALVALHFARPDVISMASAITLGAIASATAPAATLMVVKQYKASGPLTRLLLMVVAIDDAVGLVLFSASFGIANALEQGRIDPISILLEPLVEIVLSLGLGALAGLLLNQLEIYFHSRSKRMSLSVAFVLLTVGLSMVSFEVGPIHCSFSLLLVCMMTGTVFCNICPTSDELMDRLDRWVSPVNILFFVLSGAELDLNILANPMVLLIGAVYIASRSLGKISGSYVSCKATRCSEKIQKYLGITLLPQAGVALGMAAEAAELSDGHMVRNVVLFSVLVYELVGPTLAKLSLTAAGEIIPEGRTSARTTNKPEEPVSVE